MIARDGSGSVLAEDEAASLLAAAGVPFAPFRRVATPEAAVEAAEVLGFPVVLKCCGAGIAHKSERGLVRLGVSDPASVRRVAAELLAVGVHEGVDPGGLIVAQTVRGARELLAGVHRDPQLGAVVALGVGGVLSETVADVVFRLAPVTRADVDAMADELGHRALLGPVRGEPAVERDELAAILCALAQLADERPELVAAECNPIVVADGHPVAVDALVALAPASSEAPSRPRARPRVGDRVRERFAPLFEPRAVAVAGASAHPGKFGFVALHNVLAHGFGGEVYPINPSGGTLLGRPVLAGPDELPAGAVDLVVVCTPADAAPTVLRRCAARGVRAAFVATGGYGESGAEGRAREDALARAAQETGMLLAGPNGQGLVSTPVGLCAQIVAPYPPAGGLAVASQSGNLVSTFENLARASGVGISRAVSVGNAATLGVADYVEYFAHDPATSTMLLYVEDLGDGRTIADRLALARDRGVPAVVVHGGATAAGRAAAASHTGALAGDDALVRGLCRQAGAVHCDGVDEAFDAAATFATQPLPRGPRTVVLTTVGGWGVLAADALARSSLELVPLPETVREAIDAEVPERWSRRNPIDLAGGETRDTIPAVLAVLAEHPDVDAVILLGLGVQSNVAATLRAGPFWPTPDLERVVAYHERQDTRYAEAAAAASAATGKPVLVATELAVAEPGNAAPAAVRATGRYCYPSVPRAVRALEHAWSHARARGSAGRGEP